MRRSRSCQLAQDENKRFAASRGTRPRLMGGAGAFDTLGYQWVRKRTDALPHTFAPLQLDAREQGASRRALPASEADETRKGSGW